MRPDIPPLAEVRRITEKKRDAWWTVLLVDPVATPLVRWTAMHTRATPNQLTWGAFLVGLGSAACFAQGDWRWLLLGALLYHVSFIFDCMDGKLARLTGTGSVFGAWLDFVFDRIRVLVCAVALMGGQYERTGDVLYIWLALAVTSLDALRYINALETFKIRHGMREQIKARMQTARESHNEAELAFMEDLLRENPEADVEHDRAVAAKVARGTTTEAGAEATAETARGTTAEAGAEATAEAIAVTAPETSGEPTVVDLQQEFRRRFPWWTRCRSFLTRHRVRAHLISGIEFQMGVFIIGPVLDSVLAGTVVSGVLLLVFELAIIYKLLLSTRDFTRTLNSFEPTA
ncbi:CDP-alcohol phosphatidyltransferase family protein [Streptomyces sp. FXJ1.4098]|uniref:CDP-alcohol phosphatidyltransferase family protein n=1 Tax=Streptomyces sp. NPDC020845 TaxID=3365096 RepID=UPI0029938E96|nr:CDP-alcohol phosphatidyltransferase family protein [Streptomyces sp. FXJ1.4098]